MARRSPSFRIEGLQATRRNVAAVRRASHAQLDIAVKAAAQEVAGTIKDNITSQGLVDTGTLRRSVVVRKGQ